ncbi:uncharacterized protein LOC120674715 [Panicum virgatum]|uniref:uncharacterized protein LOC120674715 n=1 Tax=Panicum virgatum TaxID=38727 RepID=UPI0019D69C3F|nr:uncharacterized protein LOC120674715 [Panicum virgatum]
MAVTNGDRTLGTCVLGNIEQLNGSNYASWKEKLEITLALLDIDYALHKDPPVEPKPEDENFQVLKKEYDEEKSARDYLTKIEKQFKGSSKAYATTLIKRLVGEKYDATGSLREHIMKKYHMASKLKSMEMEIYDGFLVHFIMSSLPQEFSPFVINYNSMKIKWGIDELIAMCVQEEERLKAEKIDHANQFKHSEKKRCNNSRCKLFTGIRYEEDPKKRGKKN